MTDVVVFEQAPPARDASVVQGLIARLADTARHIGLRVVALPYTFGEVTVADALDRVPQFQDAIGFLSGFISEPDYYAELHHGALTHGIRMINSPDQTRSLMEFDRYYRAIADLTARSVVVRTAQDAERAIEELGSPVFIKGLVKSRKEAGWDACVAHDAAEIVQRLAESRRYEVSERDVVVAREILPLRQGEHRVAGFPVSREYRVYVLDGRVLGMGFYWKGHDSFGALVDDDRRAIEQLAVTAAGRLDARLAAVDVGQLSDGSWCVIELGDPQYSGIAHMPHLSLWNALQSAACER